ncbi:YT521-B-like domain-containing protein [Phyllosticta citriasiana]|uniref:YT521-B-like domain-containing protein n=1 Tax=Phyllosticta citriasiana TaxID=595635 RepID=UPI0030FD583C
MGDASNESGIPPSASLEDTTKDEAHRPTELRPENPTNDTPSDPLPSANNPSLQAQYEAAPPPNRPVESQRTSQQPVPYAYHAPPMHGQNPSAFNMGAVSGALPDYNPSMPGQGTLQPQHQAQRGFAGPSGSPIVYQYPQMPHYPGHATVAYPSQASYGTGYAPTQYGSYPSYAPNPQRNIGPGQMQPYNPYLQSQQYMYYSTPYPAQSPMTQAPIAYGSQRMDSDSRRDSFHTASGPGAAGRDPSMMAANFVGMGGNPMAQAMGGDYGPNVPMPLNQQIGPPRSSSDAGLGSLPRGPPRKPRQSGHALWVGNLPPGTTVTDLKDHFSREATKDIESLFLISKSNCAFVNYRTEASCTAAMHRFHDSRFHGVRLVCRLRRSATPASGVPTGPLAMAQPRPPSSSPPQLAVPQPPSSISEGTEGEAPSVSAPEETPPTEEKPAKVHEKFFIVKSLTLQDLELSVRNGIWATQTHNEEALNKAYESAENVYLIFSANKSGEYFGYARMASPITDEGIELVSSANESQAPEAVDTPKSIMTPATEWAPKGRIIDDSARGTIFWEADISDDEEESEKPERRTTDSPDAAADAAKMAQTWGKPFKVEWISTNRLPFYRTRGLRNPWNANREVKIARDGTELETSVGKRLVQMFHRLGPATVGPPATMPLMQMQMPSQTGGLQVRPF